MLSVKHPGPLAAKAYKIYVETKHSFDGRSLEGFWLDYDPNETVSLFLLTRCLDLSEYVESYTVFDGSGDRVPLRKRQEWEPPSKQR